MITSIYTPLLQADHRGHNPRPGVPVRSVLQSHGHLNGVTDIYTSGE